MTTSASRLSSSATCRLAVVSYLVATASSFSVLIERTNLLPSSAVAFSTTARSTCFVPKRPLQMSSPDSDGESFDLSKLGDEDFVALKLIVSGNIGGYYRACIKNEAERFRGLGGSMTDTDEDGKAEINVEGPKKKVEGFCRWAKKKDSVGLSQVVNVEDLEYGPATGLYEGFYLHME
eukprot:CAMPEP_0113311860 /NCGR_PEP_ID=MMETSP0010_2-20120614/8918_1 /TAXON_ID=216773 ORGANISM="Corethron hystrix, Strain 308" /NCGR_SAMPLE_ID=MMETSP0010_2 /ASSEMBLY_ACC=CAM_ASM_000155 /LENGTH=177 /DNA_ID=CAMNT_0000167563 /DNA_START=129 /DNA_END=662 /DNA_ORIENTATION=- /assembly_acc=CAM_ASM_000155